MICQRSRQVFRSRSVNVHHILSDLDFSHESGFTEVKTEQIRGDRSGNLPQWLENGKHHWWLRI